jgi:hypothetical protein
MCRSIGRVIFESICSKCNNQPDYLRHNKQVYLKTRPDGDNNDDDVVMARKKRCILGKVSN